MNTSDLANITEINGRKLSKSQANVFKRMAKLGVIPANAPAVRTNPYSGVSHTLEPLAVTLHDFVVNSYKAGMVGRLFPVSVWDNARYTFLAVWPKEFYDLID